MKDDTPLTDEELRAQVDTVMFAGHDTTSIGITWTLFLLGNNPEYQEKVHEELKEVFGDSESPASIKEISELKYLERVFKETLRMFPSVPIVSRKLSEDVKLGKRSIFLARKRKEKKKKNINQVVLRKILLDV
ncbi:hypothetical protein PUN28_000481 [Cardiocondyla obscurior]|uniref:Cytochrome P450 n=2 Tax=Cardiocondyla obscurior TaxID=286306 RepID=A0AAW2GZN9_9HYME